LTLANDLLLETNDLGLELVTERVDTVACEGEKCMPPPRA
jgi:hypothetical protein